MFEVTTFLMRWLFLSNLVRDVAEIQTLPFQPYHPPPPPPQTSTSRQHTEEIWRDQCVRGILSYAPGTQRALVMDALRTDLVQKLCQELRQSDEILRRQAAAQLQREVADRKVREKTESSAAENDDDDPFLDADVEIVKAFEEADGLPVKDDSTDATLVITDHDSKVVSDNAAVSSPASGRE